ncbi:MAG: hypothetical protein H7A30_06360 [Thermotogae bacterium]|nr:hypothetical protein [Thermotogota bacterium]
MNTKKKGYLLSVLGIALIFTALYFFINFRSTENSLFNLTYILLGIGSGIFGHGLGELIIVYSKNQNLKKSINIQKNDERTIAINNLSKAKAYDAMIYIFSALIMIMAFMNINPVAVIISVSAYLFIIFTNVFYKIKYNKEM